MCIDKTFTFIPIICTNYIGSFRVCVRLNNDFYNLCIGILVDIIYIYKESSNILLKRTVKVGCLIVCKMSMWFCKIILEKYN